MSSMAVNIVHNSNIAAGESNNPELVMEAGCYSLHSVEHKREYILVIISINYMLMNKHNS